MICVPGAENILPDTLSHLYSNGEPGTVRARSEYTYHDVVDSDGLDSYLISMPVFVGLEGETASFAVGLDSSVSVGSGPSVSSSDGSSGSWELVGGVEPAASSHFECGKSAVNLNSSAGKKLTSKGKVLSVRWLCGRCDCTVGVRRGRWC